MCIQMFGVCVGELWDPTRTGDLPDGLVVKSHKRMSEKLHTPKLALIRATPPNSACNLDSVVPQSEIARSGEWPGSVLDLDESEVLKG